VTAEVVDTTATEAADLVLYQHSTPVPRQSALIALAGTVEEIVAGQQAYQECCKALLDDDDYQTIGSKQFKTRSAWNKLGVAFGVSIKILSEKHERDERGRIVRTEFHVTAIASNGREQDGVGACDIFERCCGGPDYCDLKEFWEDSGKPTNHKHCKADCPGWIHFSHPGHDVPATAFTRASNRAKADLFGLGDVSAEEVGGDTKSEARAEQGARQEAGRPATDKQIKFVNDLISQTGVDLLSITAHIGREVVTANDLTGPEAKKAIDTLIAIRDGKMDRPEPPPEHRTTAEPTSHPTPTPEATPISNVVEAKLASITAEFKRRDLSPEDRKKVVERALTRDVPAAWSKELTEPDLDKILAYLNTYGPDEEPF